MTKTFTKGNLSWKLFDLGGGYFLYDTYTRGGTLRDLPSSLRPFLEIEGPCAKTTCSGIRESRSSGNLYRRESNITSYLLRARGHELERAARKEKKRILLKKAHNVGLDDFDFGVKMECVDSEHGARIISGVCSDIIDFYYSAETKDSPAPWGVEVEIVEEIRPSPAWVYNDAEDSQTAIKPGKGVTNTNCPIEVGINVSRGCISGMKPDGTFDLESRCRYCYAHQNCVPATKTAFNFESGVLLRRIPDYISEKRPAFIRISQNSEAMMPPAAREWSGFRDQVPAVLRDLKTLKELREQETYVLFPTKYPVFDGKTAGLLRDLEASFLISIGYEALEKGAVAFGFDTMERMKQGLEFAKEGVNVNLYVQTDITRPLSEMQDEAKRALDFFYKHRPLVGIHFLDARITRAKDARMIGGDDWGNLKYDTGSFFGKEGRFSSNGQNHLHAMFTHPDFIDLVDDTEIGLCSTHIRAVLEEGEIRVLPESELPKIRHCSLGLIDRLGDVNV